MTAGPGALPALDASDVAAVCAYMNREQPEAVRFIARQLGGVEAVESATLVDITPVDAVIEVHAPAEATVRLPWAEAVRSRADMRTQLFALLDRASTR